jgi:proteasome lid subunit RPN8/RPN11
MKMTVQVPERIIQQMIDHALLENPNECCGVIGGKENRLDTLYPMRNDQASPTRYVGNPKDLFDAVKQMRLSGEDMTGIYHSHPTSKAYPSATDIAENGYPGLFYFIVSLLDDEPDVKCFQLPEDGSVVVLEIVSI